MSLSFFKTFNRKNAAPDSQANGAGDSEQGSSVIDVLDSTQMREGYQSDALNSIQSGNSSMMPDLLLPDNEDDKIEIPILGRSSGAKHQFDLLVLLGFGVVVLFVMAAWVFNEAKQSAQQLAATGQSLMQSQRLAKSVSQALVGNANAFDEVADSANGLTQNFNALVSGDDQIGVNDLGSEFVDDLEKIKPLIERAKLNADAIGEQKEILTQVGQAMRVVNRQSSQLLESAAGIADQKLAQGAPATEISAAGQLVMLTQRIAKSINEFLTAEGVSPEAQFLLGKDLNSFKDLSKGLLDGNADYKLAPTRDLQTRDQIETLIKMYEETRRQADAVLGNLENLGTSRKAQASIIDDSENLRKELEALQDKLSKQTGPGMLQWSLLGIAIAFVLLCGLGISRVQLLDSRNRQVIAESHQLDARRQEQEAKRVNDANQAAILRLMNELQTVAEGDLTQEATVTEDITGAIADSVNYTVEELRQLVGSVQNTVTRVAQTTAQVDSTSTELLAASTEQLREIRETGKSVLDMANRINEVSTQAQESATVARQSLQAADSGLQAVQNAIGGMNSIRDQIQETSKRIKRLGESSQEIGEITELISDITEQTNVLALNAAIQAASAGEAGRGFSVVAEEVQRLAERSADATRQIAALVKAIQTDTQDAVAAMERSTQGVVEGARLSDSAGTALSEIDQVSRRLAELIEQISTSTSREAVMANEVADNIQHIFAVTEQTGEGTRTTAQQVRELSHMAEELRQSVSRFKIA